MIFSTNLSAADRVEHDLKRGDRQTSDGTKWQHTLKEAWCELVPEFDRERVAVVKTVQEAVEQVKELCEEVEQGVDVLVVGSLHLVGAVVRVAGLEGEVFA